MKEYDYEDIQLKVKVSNYREAIRASANILKSKGKITEDYIDEIFASVEKHGMYIVIAQGIALPHAKPSESVLKSGVSILTLAQPIEFGSEKNDPVSIVCTIASINIDDHLGYLKKLGSFLADENNINWLLEADTSEDAKGIIDSLNNY